jgi:hypothetical protein
MPFANFFGSSSKPQPDQMNPEDETPYSTPPGAQTPHPPDALLDKRSPGIFSSYFGQVRKPSTTSVPRKSQELSRLERTTSRKSIMQKEASPPKKHPKHTDITSQEAELEKHLIQNGYPTPPISSVSTPHPDAKDSSANASNPSNGTPTPQELSQRIMSPALDHLLSSRSNTLTSNPLTSVTTTQTVHASHISNPGLHISHSNTSSPFTPRHSVSKPPPGQEGLTRSATHQSTPPRTPRQSSNSASRAHSPQSSPSRSDESSRNSLKRAVTGETKGRLSITISAGRGLKPSVEPYVVCSFQWNEYISKGPQNDESVAQGRTGSPRRALPIKRTASDMGGKPMAIPMKSRQSSHTSIASRRSDSSSSAAEVTDPVWNHDATL